MKRFIQLGIIVTGVFLFSLQGLADGQYEIVLKSGRVIATDGYYEEGEKIYYIKYGSNIGVRKADVREIKEIRDDKENYDTVEMSPCTKKCGNQYKKCLNTDDKPNVQVLAKYKKDGSVASRDGSACQMLYDDCIRVCGE